MCNLKEEVQKLIEQKEKDYDLIGEILNNLVQKLDGNISEEEFKGIEKWIELYSKCAEKNREELKGLYERLETIKKYNIEMKKY